MGVGFSSWNYGEFVLAERFLSRKEDPIIKGVLESFCGKPLL